MDFILQICNTCRKTKRVYCSMTCQEQKPLIVLQNYSPFSQNHHFKIMPFHSKTPISVAWSALKFRSQLSKVRFRWLRDHFETTFSHRNLCFDFFEQVLLLSAPAKLKFKPQGRILQCWIQRGLGSVRMHAGNVERIEERVLILRGLIGRLVLEQDDSKLG